MVTQAKRYAGSKAKQYGDLFETIFETKCKFQGIAVTRIPDGCKQLGANKLIRVKSPFDWICSYQGKTALIDTKTSDTDTFPHSKISEHQALALLQHEQAGGIAGYVIWLRKVDKVLFVKASLLNVIRFAKGSLKPGAPKEPTKDIIELGNGNAFHLTKIYE